MMRLLIALLAALACFLALLPAGAADTEAPGAIAHLARRLRVEDAWLWGVPVGVLLLVRLMTGGWLTALIALPAGFLVLNTLSETLARRRTQGLRDHLQEALLSLSTSLKAGQSLARALERCASDLRRLHPRGGPMLQEFDWMVREVEMGLPIDEALLAFRERMDLEEVASLVDSVVTTRRRGGNIVEVMGNVTQMLADRLAIEREIQVMTAQKRTEATILALIPLGIYLVTRMTNPDYLAVFHATVWGQIALGLILLAVTGGYWMAQRMARIDL